MQEHRTHPTISPFPPFPHFPFRRRSAVQLGFVTAILPELSLEEVAQFAGETGFDCVEVMCWPPGKAERRYAGVTHLDVTAFDEAAAAKTRKLCESAGVAISGLGYYPNPLCADEAESNVYARHLETVIR